MTPEYIAMLGMKVSAKMPLTDQEQADVEAIMAPSPYLQDLVFKDAATPTENTSST